MHASGYGASFQTVRMYYTQSHIFFSFVLWELIVNTTFPQYYSAYRRHNVTLLQANTVLGNSKAKIGGAIIVTKKVVCLDRTLERKVIIMVQWSGDTGTFLSLFG